MNTDTAKNLDSAVHAFGSGRFDEADQFAASVLKARPFAVEALLIRGVIAGLASRHNVAERFFRDVINIDGNHYVAMFNLANSLCEQGFYTDALQWYQRSITVNEKDSDIWIGYGRALAKSARFSEAISSFESAIKLDESLLDAYTNIAICHVELGAKNTALEYYERAINLDPKRFDILISMGSVLESLDRKSEALVRYLGAIEVCPSEAKGFRLAGALLHQLGKAEEAINFYTRSLELDPGSSEAWNNLGLILQESEKFEDSYGCFKKALSIAPGMVEALNNLGNVLRALDRHDDAINCYRKAIELRSDSPLFWINLGNTLSDTECHEQALHCFLKAYELEPNQDFLLGHLLHSQMKLCDWKDWDIRVSQAATNVKNDNRVSYPFNVLGFLDSPEIQKHAAEIYTSERLPLAECFPVVIKSKRHEKIRLGYFSPDFREHPVSHLSHELLARHDRNRFEVFCFSFGVNTQDATRKRIELSVDTFVEVGDQSDDEIAELARGHEIDIAIDLCGHTANSRPKIFKQRVAPIQISYLGYPGTWGDKCIDYLIGDNIVIPVEYRSSYTENIIYLANQFQVNPSNRGEISLTSSKQQLGLPGNKVVLGCFNNSWKITPTVFRCWMRILKNVPNAILWIYADNQVAENNLLREAHQQGVATDRIFFAKKISYLDYLAQYTHLDLFLDTTPYNAGTTASDALWMGIPVLTQIGRSFASRMAASLLLNSDLSELVTESPDDYEAVAIELASNSESLTELKHKVARQKLVSPLFQCERFSREIDTAFEAVFNRYRSGLSPADLHLE